MTTSGALGRWRAILVVAAIANLAAGVALSFRGGREGDLFQVVQWTREWVHGLDPYSLPGAVVDYPPWALVAIAPLAWVPDGVLMACWVSVNLALVAWLVALLTGSAAPPGPSRVLIAALLGCAASLRTLNQFSLLSFTLAIAGAAAESRAAGAALLGVGLFKPHVGGALALWIWLRGERARVLAAIAVVLALTLAFCLYARVDLVTLGREYAACLKRTHSDLAAIPGHTDIRSALALYAPALDGGLTLSALLVVVLLVPLGLGVWRAGGRMPGDDLGVAAFCGVVSLLAVRHLSYDLILLLPLVIAWRVTPFADPTATGQTRTIRFWMLTAALVLEVPSLYRRVLAPAGLTAFAWLTELDRALCVVVWLVLARSVSRPAARVQPRAIAAR
jgi:hypothetical protein